MPRELSRRSKDSMDRRLSNRLSIDQEVRYKRFGAVRAVTGVGSGKVLNISGNGILFTSDDRLTTGERVEVAVSWPARLNETTPLKLVIQGTVVRSEEKQGAVAISRYEFKTCGSEL